MTCLQPAEKRVRGMNGEAREANEAPSQVGVDPQVRAVNRVIELEALHRSF